MARVWTCGFELNSAKELYNNSGATFATNIVRSGNYSAKTNPTATTKSFLIDISGATFKFIRTYMYIETLPSADSIIIRTSSNGAPIHSYIKLTTTGTLQLFNGSDVQIGSDSSALSTGQWYRIDLKTIAGVGTNGVIEGRVSGSVFATSSSQGLTLNPDSVDIGVITSTTASLYWDDIAINDASGSSETSYPSDAKLAYVFPGGAGDNTQFTIGGSVPAVTNWQSVNEIPPDDGVTFVGDNTVGDIDDYTVTANALSSTDTINVIQVGTRLSGAAASSNASFVTRLKAASAGTVSESSARTPIQTAWSTNNISIYPGFPVTSYTTPGTSNAWTKTDVASAQIGQRISTGNTNNAQISTLWMIIDYIPGPATRSAAGARGTASGRTGASARGAASGRTSF